MRKMQVSRLWTPLRSAFGVPSSALVNVRDHAQQPAGEVGDQLKGLIIEVARLGREQFRATTLLESCGSSLDQLGEAVREHIDQELREHAESARALSALEDQIWVRVVMDLLPVLDALQASIIAARGFMQSSADRHAYGRRTPAGSSLGLRIWRLLEIRPRRPNFFKQTAPRGAESRNWLSGGPSAALLGAHHKPLEPDLLTALEGWLEGLVLVERRLMALLDREGVRPMAAVGQAFDPHYHLAAAVSAERGVVDGTIVAEEVRGYVLGDRILRHAEVVVARSNHLAEGVGDDTDRRD